MGLQEVIEQELRQSEPGLPDEVYQNQARQYMGAMLGSKMREIIHHVFGDDLVNIVNDARRSDKKLARELIHSSTQREAKQRIFRDNRKLLRGRYPSVEDALRPREIQELMKAAAKAMQNVQKTELAAAKRELAEARGKNRPRSEARVNRLKESGRVLPILLRGGPRTVAEHELFLAEFS